MRFKLDRNLDRVIGEPLIEGGHDLKTAEEQLLQRADDLTIVGVCKAEHRGRVRIDLRAGQVLFEPS